MLKERQARGQIMKSSLSLYLSGNKEATDENCSKQNLGQCKMNKMPIVIILRIWACVIMKILTPEGRVLGFQRGISFKPANHKLKTFRVRSGIQYKIRIIKSRCLQKSSILSFSRNILYCIVLYCIHVHYIATIQRGVSTIQICLHHLSHKNYIYV